jgi:hypothetical protein
MQKLITQGAANVNGKIQFSVIVSDICDGWYINDEVFTFKTLVKAKQKFQELLEMYPTAKVVENKLSWVA